MIDFSQTSDGVEICNLSNFDIAQTLDCGQCFRWEKLGERYRGIASKRNIEVSQIKSKVFLFNVTAREFESFWVRYFDLSTDYLKISETFSDISLLMSEVVKECSGIRILKQDFWEVLCSFIISQNNNIPRIKKIVNSLCVNFGEDIGGGYSFPSAEVLANLSEEDLSVIRAGFRSKYILDAARKVASGVINEVELQGKDIDEVQSILMTIKGVGVKVAQCVILYGMHNLAAFPVDVWMRRVMDKFFANASTSIFGEYAGVAQQYLYHYSRNHPEIFE